MKETSTLNWWTSRTCSMQTTTKTTSAVGKATRSHLDRSWMTRDLLRESPKRSSRGTHGWIKTNAMQRSTTDSSCWIIWRLRGHSRIKTTIQWETSHAQTVRTGLQSNDPTIIWHSQPPCMTPKTSDKMLRIGQRSQLTQPWETSLAPGLVAPHQSTTTQWLTTIRMWTRREALTT